MQNKKATSQTNTYRTVNLNEAAFFMSLGHKVNRTMRVDGKVVFVFADGNTDWELLKNHFYNNTTKIYARDFSDNLRSLKDMIYTKDHHHG